MLKKIKNKISTTRKLYLKIRENKSISAVKALYLVFLLKFNITAFRNKAVEYRNKLNIPVIAVTGTNGKTTTKELIATVLSKKYKVASTGGNYNNHIGVPLTILSIDKTVDIAVIEMGANHPGEIKHLAEIAKPTHGLITNIGIAHLEGFGSFEGVKKTKNELYNFLKENRGIIFSNKDNNILQELLGDYPRIKYGTSDADCCGKFIDNNPFVSVEWNYKEHSGIVNSNLIGQYNFENILAAITIGNFFGVDAEKINNAIENYFPDNKRSQYTKTDNNTIIQDCYNANPFSMKLAIENFINLKGNDKCLIIGDMLELGESSKVEHDKILKLIADNSFENVFLIGSNFFAAKNENYPNFSFYNNVDDLVCDLKTNKLISKTILIKGSHGIRLEKCIAYL